MIAPDPAEAAARLHAFMHSLDTLGPNAAPEMMHDDGVIERFGNEQALQTGDLRAVLDDWDRLQALDTYEVGYRDGQSSGHDDWERPITEAVELPDEVNPESPYAVAAWIGAELDRLRAAVALGADPTAHTTDHYAQ